MVLSLVRECMEVHSSNGRVRTSTLVLLLYITVRDKLGTRTKQGRVQEWVGVTVPILQWYRRKGPFVGENPRLHRNKATLRKITRPT